MAQARGVALEGCARRTKELYEYTPLQVKQAVVGYGRAEKQQVQFMVKTLLQLRESKAGRCGGCVGHCDLPCQFLPDAAEF